MYPRNAASPPRIYVGPVVQISDGAVQTSGVAVTVTPEGGSETAGAGTVAYSTKGGVWYSPTQAETNYTAFMVEASKSGCIPAGTTVVTTAAAVAGKASLDADQAVNVTKLLGTAPTEGAAGRLAAAFTKFFDKASPTGTINSLPDAVAGAASGVAIVGSVMGKSPATLAAADVSGNLPADLKAITAGVDLSDTMKTSAQAAADAALVANNLDHLAKTATAAADMTTEVADNTVLARVLAGGDTSTYSPATAPLKLLADIDAETDRIKDGGDLDTIIDDIHDNLDKVPKSDGTVAFNSTAANGMADALLKRDWTSVTGEAARSVLNALRFLRNKWTLSSSTLSVKKEDDSTEAWGGTVSTDASADPVTGNDPT